MNQDLKTCPFCGGNPQAVEKQDVYIIQCEECGAKVTSIISFYYSAREKAIRTWNRRVQNAAD